MDLRIQTVHFNADKKLIEFIEKKLTKIEKMWDAIQAFEVTLKLDNDESAANKVVDIRVLVPGVDIISRKQSPSFEEAVDGLIDVLQRQVIKAKEKKKEI